MGKCGKGGSFQVSSCKFYKFLFLSYVYHALEFSS